MATIAQGIQPVPPLSANIGQACYECFKEQIPGGPNMLRCSACKRVVYCGSACQKKNWPRHKGACAALATMEKDGLSPIARILEVDDVMLGNEDAVNAFAHRMISFDARKFEQLVGRQATVPERNLIAWEPRCAACGYTDTMLRNGVITSPTQGAALARCSDCRTTFFCSKDHAIRVKDAHSVQPRISTPAGILTQCQANQQIRQDVSLTELMRGAPGAPAAPLVWAPDRRLAKWESLKGSTWDSEFMKELKGSLPLPPQLALEPFLRAASDGLSLPMSILQGFEILYGDDQSWTEKEKLAVHVIGASELEVMNSMVFEEILHRLPSLKHLEIVLCGPDIAPFISGRSEEQRTEPMETCPDCASKGRKRVHVYVPQTWHEYVDSQGPKFVAPDLAIAFNGGISEVDKDLWKPTIERLIEMNIPSVFTGFNEHEANTDAAVLAEAGAQLVDGLGPRANPWGSMLLKTEPGRVSGFYANNGWLSGGFKGRASGAGATKDI